MERTPILPAWDSRQRPFEALRSRMVEEQLRGRGIRDPRVLEVMGRVPREEFVPSFLRGSAYEDRPLPIGHGQTISQPFTVALLCQALALRGHERVLEIGTGSGYGAAVLGELAASVHTIERIPHLAREARSLLARLDCRNVEVVEGDGSLGLPGEAPFDAIAVTAGSPGVPKVFLDQLAEGGRLVIPVNGRADGERLYRFTLRKGRILVRDLGGFAFVPLVGLFGWQQADEEC